ncbi:TonB-dependent receptor [Xanthomonas translucens]|uniref:TonB-dependent receptor n=2 Tax=Xanthomonas campestris pv. translucens TaxID=343 RepID=UPI000A79C3EB|nr:TonB-dependent receptor [Xanthomonas translucens]WLA08680.1 TonB-dependent receptor [Xanthomonas translucens]
MPGQLPWQSSIRRTNVWLPSSHSVKVRAQRCRVRQPGTAVAMPPSDFLSRSDARARQFAALVRFRRRGAGPACSSACAGRGGWVANLNANFRDTVYTDIGTDVPQLASRTLLNAKFGYENLNWSAWVFANNLLDRQYIQYRWADQPVAILGAPRVVGIGFEARW